MFGMEKKGKGPFEFDLEEELKKDPSKTRALLKEIEGNVSDIKTILRSGARSEDFDNYGILLHGYAALQRVLGRIAEKR